MSTLISFPSGWVRPGATYLLEIKQDELDQIIDATLTDKKYPELKVHADSIVRKRD